MPKLYSNPWKDNKNFKSKIKYSLRKMFYKWLLRKYCRGFKTVLDVACGPGHFMKTAEELGFKAYGVELDERDRKSTRLNSSHSAKSRMPSSA